MATAVLRSNKFIPVSKPLTGRVALVTGASRGIGRAIAMELASRGAHVAINFKSSLFEAESLHSQLGRDGSESILVPGDVSKPKESQSIVEQVLDTFEHIDILVNNAGITRDRCIRKMSDEEWVDVIDTNLNSAFYCTRAALPSMIENNFGRIINVSSFVGQCGAFGQANYAASKAGIIGLTKVTALEVAKYNVTVNVLCPGYTSTDMVKGVPEHVLNEITSRVPLKRLAEPEEIAKAAAFLITDGSYITGQQININGGLFM